MISLIASKMGLTPASLAVSMAMHGLAVVALVGFNRAHNSTQMRAQNEELRIFEVAFETLAETSYQEVPYQEPLPIKDATPPEQPMQEKAANALEKTKITLPEQKKKTNPSTLSATNSKTSVQSKSASEIPNQAVGIQVPAHESTSPHKVAFASPQHVVTLSSWINRHKFYPHEARRKGEEGTVLIRIQLSPEGEIDSYQMLKSSGSPALDRAATEILKRSAPYPEEFVHAFASAEVPLTFSLQS